MKTVLHNKINKRELRERLHRDPEPRATLSFYRYLRIADPAAFRDALYADLSALGVMGRIYVASEGYNAQISVPAANLDALKQYFAGRPDFAGNRLNFAIEDDGKSFVKLAIKVRDKIVADGVDDATFDVTQRGTYLSAAAYNDLTDRPETVVVDMRNHYEYEVGHFAGARHLDSDTFREALQKALAELADLKDAPVVMYCTGGIRCEKASAYLRHHGFRDVYMVDGGIIEYARQAEAQGLQNKFLGKNFVFDERLGERIGAEIISACHQCGHPADTHINCRNDVCHQLFIQCAECAAEFNGCCSAECRDVTEAPVEVRNELRKSTAGKPRPVIYRKGRTPAS